MARYDHLTVFKNTYELSLYFYKLAKGFPKDFKYGLAEEIKSLLTELMDQIVIANNSIDKTSTLNKAVIIIERVKIKARLLHDLKIISIKSYEYFFCQLVEISKQIERWSNWAQQKPLESIAISPV
ncbi:MAG: four helix bundle protein [Patescibacteria group bacterium]|nr:four helix bundle protein [Patescibacteria group bacterium]